MTIRSDYKYTLKDRITDWLWPVRRLYRQIGRAFTWAKFGWNNCDWDHGFLLKMMVFKMKLMYQAIYVNGHHEPEKRDKQSLELCIKLGEKILKDDYRYFLDLHDQKWGPLEFIEKQNAATGRTFTGMGRSRVGKEQEAQEREEFLEAYKKDDSVKARDYKWFFGILAKYFEQWSD